MRVRVSLVVLGCAAMAYALWQLVIGGKVTSPLDSGAWIVAAALAHDLVLAPVVAVTGLLLARLAPRSVRPVVAGGLVAAGCLLLLAVPLLLDRGEQGNPTTTPLDYPRGLLVSLSVVTALTAALAVLRVVRRRNTERRPGKPL